jgi:hypothetical protein
MDNWLNTKAGRDFSMRTIPDMTKALNRLADALLVQDDSALEEAIGERDWQADAFMLYKALSRFNKAHGHKEIVAANTMAFDILSKVSWDFRNEYVCHEWPEANDEHGKKKWISMIEWHCDVCCGAMFDHEGNVVLKGNKYPCQAVPASIDYEGLVKIAMEGGDDEPELGYEEGHYETILNLEIGSTHVTEEPFNGFVIWRRVE